MQNFRRLRVWEAARKLALEVIALPERAYRRVSGLRSQTTDAAQSIPANIAEGAGRASRTEFARYLEIAMGSLNELETHLAAARDASVIDLRTFNRLKTAMRSVGRMLWALYISVVHSIALEEDAKRTRRLRKRTAE